MNKIGLLIVTSFMLLRTKKNEVSSKEVKEDIESKFPMIGIDEVLITKILDAYCNIVKPMVKTESGYTMDYSSISNPTEMTFESVINKSGIKDLFKVFDNVETKIVANDSNAKSTKTEDSVPKDTSNKDLIKMNRSQLINVIKQSAGKFITVTWIKKNGQERSINCKIDSSSFNNPMGYILVKTNKGKFKNIDSRKLISVTSDSKTNIINHGY